MARKKKPGTYDHILHKLPRMLGVDPPKQLKVMAIKEAMRTEDGFRMWSSHLAKQYAIIRTEKELAQLQLGEIELRLEAISQLMADQFENEGVSKIDLNDGMSVTVFYEPTGKVIDKEKFRLWCIANGYVKSMHLHAKTMVTVLKERLADSQPEPEGIEPGQRRVIRYSSGTDTVSDADLAAYSPGGDEDE